MRHRTSSAAAARITCLFFLFNAACLVFLLNHPHFLHPQATTMDPWPWHGSSQQSHWSTTGENMSFNFKYTRAKILPGVRRPVAQNKGPFLFSFHSLDSLSLSLHPPLLHRRQEECNHNERTQSRTNRPRHCNCEREKSARQRGRV